MILLPARYKKRIKPLISNSTLPEIIQNAPDEENNVFYIVNQNKKHYLPKVEEMIFYL
ncbi:hypothetical protein HMPREF9466_01596 [Fusobacterium necrophorum subsp. funduliforme 1_1_36S]|nr:hypothetical protein HMPREF9466_01596 [Fusobacterium necrophorum subsp. funduliforme 1_1_36S]